MQGSLTIDLSQFLLSVSMALDAVEREVLGAAGGLMDHAKRVAYLSVRLGRTLGFSPEALTDLACYAALHDNALSEYIVRQRLKGNHLPPTELREDLDFHCSAGERNIAVLPFHTNEKNVLLYHHENMDGTGMFGVKGESIPLMARILRIFDDVDSHFLLSSLDRNKAAEAKCYLEQHRGGRFDSALVRPAAALLEEAAGTSALTSQALAKSLKGELLPDPMDFSHPELIKICGMFAHIIDCKSPFTMRHSAGIAEKACALAAYYNLDEDTSAQLYIAALLHDVGKLAIPNALLDKPGKLTGEEYELVKTHVFITHEILRQVDGFAILEPWASGHHERLDGSGYFRGSTGKDQDFCTRLMECVDMYQALTEERPYREGWDHERTMSVLRRDAEAGKLDKTIVQGVDSVFKNT